MGYQSKEISTKYTVESFRAVKFKFYLFVHFNPKGFYLADPDLLDKDQPI